MQPPDGPITFGQLRLFWRQQFAAHQISTAAIDSRLLLSAAAHINQAQLISKEHDAVPDNVVVRMNGFGARRLTEEPVARILGQVEFYGHMFALNADTLVPRPETELLVDQALALLPAKGRFMDLGTGTGCIAISILQAQKEARGVATDLAQGALTMAAENALTLGVDDRLQLVKSDWFEQISEKERFDLIVSNPPYIARSERTFMNKEALAFDPEAALFAADEGMAAYHQILAGAAERLFPGGHLLLELGFRQAERLEKAARKVGAGQVTFFKDLYGHNRVARISW